MLYTASSLAKSFEDRYAEPGTANITASEDVKDPDFGGQVVGSIQAAGVLSFNSAGKVRTAKAVTPFLVLGNTINVNDLIELPEYDFKRMGPDGTGQVVEATDDDIAAAQKATKGK